MHKKQILVTRSSMPPMNEYIEEISTLWESHWITNMGKKHSEFERELKKRIGACNISLYTNGHSALECAFEALELQGKVITTPFSFVSTTHAIVRKGLTPVFADIKSDDFTIDPKKVEALIDEDTCAIVPVHVYGNLCEIEAIKKIADAYNLKVIYDAAHAFGVKKDGIDAGLFGDMSMFSFHATKVFNTIEGGALCFKDSDLADVLNQRKNFGITSSDEVEYIGGNFKMNEFCAAMGLCNLRHLDEEIAKRKIVAARYWDNLKDTQGIKLVLPADGIEPNYAYMPILFKDNFRKSRDEVYEELASHQIIARKYFYPLITDFACYDSYYDSNNTPIAQYVAKHILTLPMYADLPLSDVDRICDIIKGGKNV